MEAVSSIALRNRVEREGYAAIILTPSLGGKNYGNGRSDKGYYGDRTFAKYQLQQNCTSRQVSTLVLRQQVARRVCAH